MTDLTTHAADEALGPADAAVLGTVDPAHLTRLRDHLAGRAHDEGLVDVAYDVVETSVGPLLLATTDVGLVRVAFADERRPEVLADLARRVGPRVLADRGRLAPAARQVHEYLAGARHGFDLPVDLRLASGFRRAVLDRLREVGYGSTVSYAALASLAGSPRAVRAVGTACATNPLPVVVPCHRVLRSDGGLGGYVGGLAVKRDLLALERTAAA